MTIEAAIAEYERKGYRLDVIMPADAPRTAVISNGKDVLRLSETATGVTAEPFTGHGALVIPEGRQEFVLTRARASAWSTGRAGMQYRDLIPSRLGGRYIASHIRIPDGGLVPDYVHHHRVRFQMIFVRKGWVRVVYEDQGSPFVMHEGDCVLQPPGIRHRVLEASAGLEVIEIGSPAEHETFRDHDLALPTQHTKRDRDFGGQRFVHHVAASAAWRDGEGHTCRDTGIAAATAGLASVRVLKLGAATAVHDGDFLFFNVLSGTAQFASRTVGTHTLESGDACVLPKGADYALVATNACEILEVALPARSN
jgi:mannose-6-phosphate isomerase-like protein (cupin superfamily)